jgi:hypothetical protein
MKKITTSILFILAIIAYEHSYAQCTIDSVAPIPDVINLPEIISECTAQLKRPASFDECEGKAISGTILGIVHSWYIYGNLDVCRWERKQNLSNSKNNRTAINSTSYNYK